ncbi:zinc finger CCHC domain-containing protein 2-like protein [Leptotrombidium deliense]|uniref:Zinc finger CCHC domain-containing protein 2-like protein n=1 Tax=Leptotrombidium deliense TaxID=299467 RepID=A0A443SS45_9ACAR|nr:zinc finger CCHC domain-containing protein 2-like protein [Leptotrombidium deliense]
MNVGSRVLRSKRGTRVEKYPKTQNMVQCKEEVFEWFKELSGATRIELMCGLLNLCIPLEWRFFATVIESLARRDYASLKDYEIKANTPLEYEEIANSNWLLRGDEPDTRASTTVAAQTSDKRPVTASTDKSLNSIRSKIVVYMCLLSSSNRVCATIVHKSILKQLCVENLQQTLSQLKKSEKLDNLEAGFLLSDNMYNEIILLHTLARFHPAFTFEQQSVLGQQLHIVQHWMDVHKYAAAAASGTLPANSRCPPVGHFPQHVNQFSQTQQFHHQFQSGNKQQHPQYHHQMQQQQYASHVQSPNDFNQQLANISLSNNSLSVLPPYTLHLTVASPPGFENQPLSPAASDYSPIAFEQKSGRKELTKDTLRENDEESVRGAANELRNLGFAERLEKDSDSVGVTNGDLNDYKKLNLENSKGTSPLGSASSSNSSSPVSSASNSLNGAIVNQHLMMRQTFIENLLKRDTMRRYKDKLMNISVDELWSMSEDELITLGLSSSAAAKFRKELSHSNYNGVRFHSNADAELSESLPKRSSSPSVSPAVSFCSEKDYEADVDNERVSNFPKTQEVSGSTRMSTGTKTVSSQKWQTVHNKAVPNASASLTNNSTLPILNKQQTSSKSSSLSSVGTGSEASVKSSKTFESSVAGTTGSNRVPWKSNPSETTSTASVNKCPNCGSNCMSNCTCSVSNGSSVATTPSSTPPPAIPTQPIPSGMVHMPGGQSVIHPYWFFLPPPTGAVNGYSPASPSEQLINYWYTLAMAAASAGGLPYWPPLPSSLAFTSSIPGFPPNANVHGGNPSLIASANSQSAKAVSCYNCGAFGHRGNECPQQSLDDVVKPSTFNMNFTTQPDFDSHITSHSAHHSTYQNQAPHLQPAPHSHQTSYHYSTSPSHTFQEHSVDRNTARHGAHPHT